MASILMISFIICQIICVLGLQLQLGSHDHPTIRGMIISKTDAYYTGIASSKCQCSRLCMDDERCLSYSGKPKQDGAVLCSLSDMYPKDLSLLICAPGSFVSIKMQDLKEDLRSYRMPDDLLGFNESQQLCSSISPLYSLGIYKTVAQLNVLKRFFSSITQFDLFPCIHVSMIDNSTNFPQWTDGTYFADTELATMKVLNNDQSSTSVIYYAWNSYRGGVFDDGLNTRKCTVICVVDPLSLF